MASSPINRQPQAGNADARFAQGIIMVALVGYLVANHFNQQQEIAGLRTSLEELKTAMQKQIDEKAQQSEKHYARLAQLSKELTEQTMSVSGLQHSVSMERQEAQAMLEAMRDELQKATITTDSQQKVVANIKSEMEQYLKKVDKVDPATSNLVKELLLELEEVKTRLPQTPPASSDLPPLIEPTPPRAEPVNIFQP